MRHLFRRPRLTDETGGVSAYPFDYVEEAVAAGIIRGSEKDGRRVFQPDSSLTRLQLARMMARMMRNFKGYPEALP